MENYFDKAVIVDLTVRCWSGKTTDNEATSTVSEVYEMSMDRGNFTKFLVPKEAINELRKHEQQLRICHNRNTLPWGERGERLLPMKNYFKYMKEMEERKESFFKSVDKFIENYKLIIDKSRKDLGRLFREEEYPSPDMIRKYFGVIINVFPIPTTDFRLNFQNEEIEKIRSQLQSVLNERFKEAGRELFVRASAVVKRIKDRLTSEDPGTKYHQKMFTAVNDIVDLINALNVFESKELEELTKEIKETFGNISAKEVKMDHSLKEKVVVDADRILSKMSRYLM